MRYFKKPVSLLLLLALALTLGISAFAENSTVAATLHYRDIKITLDGLLVTPTDEKGEYVEPFIMDGTTYLPVRGIADALGLGVAWDGNTGTVMLSTQFGVTLNSTLSEGSNRAVSALLTYRDITIMLDGVVVIPEDEAGNAVEPFIIDGTTYLPVRGVASVLGLGVDWDSAASTVILTDTAPGKDGSYKTASPLVMGETVSDSFGGNESGAVDTEDWYKITLTNSGTAIWLLEAQDSMQFSLCLYAADGETKIKEQSGKGSEAGLSMSLEAGTYYLCLGSRFTGAYTLKTEFVPLAANDTGDNNSVSAATALTLPASVSGSLGFYNDKGKTDTEDWYEITLTSSGLLSLSLTADVQDMYVNLYLYQADGETRIADAGGRNQTVTASAQLEEGTYYLQVRSYFTGCYELTAAFE